MPSARAAASLRRRLLAWYRRSARDLPWRRTRDPYAIWVSEVMLQQTQVATATPYYRHFLRRFPSVRRLASATREDVLASWSGLGYYRRARLLHAAAIAVVRDHGGRVPDDPAAFARLPGVGRYTAGAVQSIAFGRPLPVLDGNVARVFSRWFALAESPRTPAGSRALWTVAESLVPMRAAGDWNQALMELGATVCLPRAPRCGACPVARSCRARRENRVAEFPPAAARRTSERVRRAVALVSRRGKWLVVRRAGALLEGLWEPPGVELANGDAAGARLAEALGGLGVKARLADTGLRVRHTITHRRIEVEIWAGEARAATRNSAATRWLDASISDTKPGGATASGGAGIPLTALARRVLRLGIEVQTQDDVRRGRQSG